MLDTIINIGKIFRQTENIKFHRYIKPGYDHSNNKKEIFLTLPLDSDWNFQLDKLNVLEDEDLKNKCYYLTFKSSEADTTQKYIWGDIKYGEGGYYKLDEKSGKKGSFLLGESDVDFFTHTFIETFRNSFKKNQNNLESKLIEYSKSYKMVFIHFILPNLEHWYEFKTEFEKLNEKICFDFTANQTNGITLRKFLYKTIASGEKNLQFPAFNSGNADKIHLFNDINEFFDLLYGIDFSKTAKIFDHDIKVIILPKGEKLTADSLEKFFHIKPRIETSDSKDSESQLTDKQFDENQQLDSLFGPIMVDSSDEMIKFDFIFSKKGLNAPDVDLVEISGLEKSFLSIISEKVRGIRNELIEKRKELYPDINFQSLGIRKAFFNILDNNTEKNKKYQDHLFKTLPKIYTDSYYNDPVLLPTFIEKVEFNLRNKIISQNFNILKYDYFFLIKIQKFGENKLENMFQDSSYKSGLLLGSISQPLSWKINSFDKNYVGLLSRRISDLDGLIKFSTFINEKLVIHGVAYPDLQKKYLELTSLIKNMTESTYNKYYCGFGFFEGYFNKFQKKDDEPELSDLNGE